MSVANIQDLVELTIFHAIRKECVGRLLLPDITTYPNTPQGYLDYQDALLDIANGPAGFAVEVFNNSNPQYKGTKKPPRIVIISENFLPGTTGVDGMECYEDLGPDIQGYTLPNMLVDFTFRVHLIASTNAQIRELNSILGKAIPHMGYKTLLLDEYPDEGEQTFFINNIGFSDYTLASDDLLERVYRYEVNDLLNSELIAYTSKYSKLVEMTINSHINQEILGAADHQDTITSPQD